MPHREARGLHGLDDSLAGEAQVAEPSVDRFGQRARAVAAGNSQHSLRQLADGAEGGADVSGGASRTSSICGTIPRTPAQLGSVVAQRVVEDERPRQG